MDNLKKLPIWICWRRELRNNKQTKIPLNPLTGEYAKSNDSSTWSFYDTAINAPFQKDGVGFVFTDGICGIDIDNAVDEENAARTLEIIALMESYTEYSPSGTGFHIIFRCDISRIPKENGKLHSDYYQKNPLNKVECYFSGLTNRYFTFTDNVISRDFGVEDRTEQVLEFLNLHMKREKLPKRGNAEEAGLSDTLLTDILNIARKAKNGKTFMKLFDVGDLSVCNNDHSSADLSLCRMLAFYSGGDASVVDSLFRRSKLYRQKWERTDYREATIRKAINSCDGEFYKKPGRPVQGKLIQEIFSIVVLEEYFQKMNITLRYDIISKKYLFRVSIRYMHRGRLLIFSQLSPMTL